MGIRFYCPNGHKLNVKSDLAGKRGICPKCEARFRIPQTSQVPRGAPKVVPGLFDEEVANDPLPIAAASVAAEAAEDDAALDSPIAFTALPDVPSDPVREAPNAAWYVRPPSGGQYGPARGEVLIRWISEGRVSADSLLWREGWPEWRPAGPLFPSLPTRDEDDVPSVQETPRLDSETKVEPVAEPSPPSTRRRHVPSRRKPFALLVALVLLIVVLSIVLGIVVWRLK
jgi:hypothetical protein